MAATDDKKPQYRRGMTTLGQSINRVTTPALRRRGFAEAAIVTDWPTIVGRPLCDHTRPSRIVFPRGERLEGTLHLVVTGAFAPEVQHLAPQIIERINGHFGYRAIARMELHHGRVDAARAGGAIPDAAGVEPGPAVTEAIGAVGEGRSGTRSPASPGRGRRLRRNPRKRR